MHFIARNESFKGKKFRLTRRAPSVSRWCPSRLSLGRTCKWAGTQSDPPRNPRSNAAFASRCSTGRIHVWSLTQFSSVDFSKSRIVVKKCIFNKNAQSRFASVVVDSVLGPPRLARHTLRCPCFSVVREARQRALDLPRALLPELQRYKHTVR